RRRVLVHQTSAPSTTVAGLAEIIFPRASQSRKARWGALSAARRFKISMRSKPKALIIEHWLRRSKPGGRPGRRRQLGRPARRLSGERGREGHHASSALQLRGNDVALADWINESEIRLLIPVVSEGWHRPASCAGACRLRQ